MNRRTAQMGSGWIQTTESSEIPSLYVKHNRTADGRIPLLLQNLCVKAAPENGAEQERRGTDNNATPSCTERTCDLSKPYCAIKDCTSGVVQVCFVDETVLCLSQPSEDQELVQSLNYSKYSKGFVPEISGIPRRPCGTTHTVHSSRRYYIKHTCDI